MQQLIAILSFASLFALCPVAWWWANCCCACGWGPYGPEPPADDPISHFGFVSTIFNNGTKTWYFASTQRLTTDSGWGSLWKTSPHPSPSWNASGANMSATCYSWQGGQRQGVFIGNCRAFFIDWAQNKFFQQPCDINGQVTGAPTALTGTVASGQTLTLAVQGGGDSNPGLFTIQYLLNGVPLVGSQETAVALDSLNTDAAMQGGVWSDGGAQFNGVALKCGIPTTCGCSMPQQICGRAVNVVGNIALNDQTFSLNFVASGNVPSWAGTPAELPQGGWLGTFPGLTVNPFLLRNFWPSFDVFLTPGCQLLVQTPPCPQLTTGSSPIAGNCGQSVCLDLQLTSVKGCVCVFLLQGVATLAGAGPNSNAFELLISDPAAGQCSRAPNRLSLGPWLSNVTFGTPTTACEMKVSPVTVTLNCDCACLNGATLELDLLPIQQQRAAQWGYAAGIGQTFQLCGATFAVGLTYADTNPSGGALLSVVRLNADGSVAGSQSFQGPGGRTFSPMWQMTPVVGPPMKCPATGANITFFTSFVTGPA